MYCVYDRTYLLLLETLVPTGVILFILILGGMYIRYMKKTQKFRNSIVPDAQKPNSEIVKKLPPELAYHFKDALINPELWQTHGPNIFTRRLATPQDKEIPLACKFLQF